MSIWRYNHIATLWPNLARARWRARNFFNSSNARASYLVHWFFQIFYSLRSARDTGAQSITREKEREFTRGKLMPICLTSARRRGLASLGRPPEPQFLWPKSTHHSMVVSSNILALEGSFSEVLNDYTRRACEWSPYEHEIPSWWWSTL